jgi:hypothetical protein
LRLGQYIWAEKSPKIFQWGRGKIENKCMNQKEKLE